MAGFRESAAKETVTYKVEPQVLAEVCQDSLKKIGKVEKVSRETGIISGKIPLSAITNPAMIVLHISKLDDGTELDIQVKRLEGVFATNGAQNALMKFLETLAQDERMKDASRAGW